jgi:PBSX family phage terminase large subunit
MQSVEKIQEQFLQVFSPKQAESIVTSNSKLNIWVGSIRSGKTYASLVRFIIECASDIKGQFCLISKTFDSFKRNILPLLADLIPSSYSWSPGKRELTIYRRKIHVIGADDERAERKIRGATFAGAYIDEVTVIPETFYQMLLSRLSVKGSKLFMTTNPDSPFHWLKQEIDQAQNMKVFEFRLDDNPNLAEETKDFYRKQYSGLWHSRFIDGQWTLAEGTVFDFFDERSHVVNTYPPSSFCLVGVDYGTVNPCAFTMLSVNPNKYPHWVVIKEYYWDSQKRQRQKTDIDYAEDLKAFCLGHPVRAIYIDPSAASFKLECRKQDITGFVDADNDVENGIRFLSTNLMGGRLKIFNSCRNLIKEFESYIWDTRAKERGKDIPLKENDHAIDALRYALYTHFSNQADPGARARIEQAWNEVAGGGSNLPGIFGDDPMPAGGFIR